MKDNLLRIIKSPRFLILAALCTILGIAAVIWFLQSGYTIETAKAELQRWLDIISAYPALAYLALLLTGGLPIPLSPVIIVVAVLFTNQYGLLPALLLCYSAMVLNMIWTYFVSAYPMRNLFEKLLETFSGKFPEIPDTHKSKVALIVRITPGFPFFLQNYFLGVSRVPFGKYLLISMGIQAFYTTGFVVGGGAIFEGKAGLAIMALCLLVIFGVIVNWIRSRNKVSGEETPADAST